MPTTSRPEKKTQHFPLKDHPTVIDLLTDIAIFTQKWTTPEIGKAVGISKQGFQRHVNKKKGKHA